VSISVVKCSLVKCGEVWRSVVMVLVIRCPTLSEDIQITGSCCLYVFCYYHILSYSLGSIFFINAYMVVWLYGYMVVWLYGYMVVWLYGYMVVWLYGCMVVWLYGYMVVWLYGYMVVWLYGYMVVWLYGYIPVLYCKLRFYCYVYVFLLYVYVSSSCQLALFGYPD
jgi:hypothetical protein